MNRGRPAGRMTAQGRAIVDCIERYRQRDLLVSISRIARECGYDKSNTRKMIGRLKSIGAI